MNQEDTATFAMAMTGAAEVLGGELTKPKLAIYFKALEHLPFEVVERGLMRAIRELRFFPKPVEVLELCGDSRTSLAEKALLESAKALEALEKHGAYSSVAFDDPVTMAVLQRGFGGWPAYSDAIREDGAKWVGKDFCKFYEAFAKQGVEVLGHLPGRCEQENALNGFERYNPPVALVGDRQKALEIAREQNALPPGQSQAGQMVGAILTKIFEADQSCASSGGEHGGMQTVVSERVA